MTNKRLEATCGQSVNVKHRCGKVDNLGNTDVAKLVLCSSDSRRLSGGRRAMMQHHSTSMYIVQHSETFDLVDSYLDCLATALIFENTSHF